MVTSHADLVPQIKANIENYDPEKDTHKYPESSIHYLPNKPEPTINDKTDPVDPDEGYYCAGRNWFAAFSCQGLSKDDCIYGPAKASCVWKLEE